jgi:Zn-finger nucleic acid-binding protein
MTFREAETMCIQCRVPMARTTSAGGHDLATCERCGGAWMDVADFLAELRAAQPKLAFDELMEHNDGTPRRPCPRCGEIMSIVWLEFLQLDQCAAHGVWFDRGELERALAGDVVPAEVAKVLRRAEKHRPAKTRDEMLEDAASIARFLRPPPGFRGY